MIRVRRVGAWLAALTTIGMSWPTPDGTARPLPIAMPVVQVVALPSVALPGMGVTVVVSQPAEAVTATLTLTLSPAMAWDTVVERLNRDCTISGAVATCGGLHDPTLPAVATLAFTVPVTATDPLVITALRSDRPHDPVITTVLLDPTCTVTPGATATVVVPPSATATEEPTVTPALPSVVPATATDAPTATATASSTPTNGPTATPTASSTPLPTATPTSLPTATPIASTPPLPSIPPVLPVEPNLPPIIVFPTLTAIPAAPIVDAPSGSTTPPVPTACVIDGQPVAVVDSQIRAGVEPCALLSLPLAVQAIPPALAHVVADNDSDLRAGPGIAYVPLAHIPRGYAVTLTGRMFQGYVEVTAFRVGAAPLAGWLWSADLIVDALLTTPLPTVADPVAVLPSPVAPLPTMADPVGVRPTATLPVLGWRLQALPPTTRTVTIQVCRGTATCGRDQGIAGMAVVVDSAAGDRVAQGWTDTTGRWVVTLPIQDGLVVRVPWLGQVVALAATADRVHLPVTEAILPPTLGGPQ